MPMPYPCKDNNTWKSLEESLMSTKLRHKIYKPAG